MDEARIDSHKLMFHVPRLNRWLDGDKVYPIYMEISPSGACNHRCKFCAMDFMGYERKFLDTKRMKRFFSEIVYGGIKSIMFGGEGEPLLHSEFPKLVKDAFDIGLDVAVTTNGSLLNQRMVEAIIPYVSWIKTSVDAGKASTYGKVHGVKPGVFDLVIRNMEYAHKMRSGLPVDLGLQMLWLPENRDEIETLAEIAKDIGMDYLVVKPYSRHPQTLSKFYADLNYHGWTGSGDSFVIFREEAFERSKVAKNYPVCYGLPFWSYLDSGGTVWGCSAHLLEDEFRYGNIYEQSFEDIWKNAKYSYPTEKCRINCRMDAENQYLWGLKAGVKHQNFI